MTDESSDVPRELMESIKDVIGRKIKISVKKKVKLEVKGDRVENKVLVLTSCRAFLLSARIPSKLELTFSYLEIHGVICHKPAQMVVETEKCNMSMKMVSPEDVSEVLAHIGTCLRRIFPGLSPLRIMKKVSMEPSERLASLQALWDSQTLAEPGPCGGFSQMYACVCDWLGFSYKEEVQWDVDTIYLTQDTRELNLQDFSHLEHRDLIPIIAALEYNQWFTKLSSKDLKLSTDVCEQILRVVSRSNRLEELVLENAGLRIDFAQKLAGALAHNPNSGLHTINLAGNSLEDRGVSSLSIQFAKLPKGLKHLNLSKTSLSPKGVNSLCQSLSANPLTASTLTHLDLSGNALRGDDLSHMYNFLAQPNTIVHLDLSNTECSLEMVCSALLRGCLQCLAVLNLSRSVFSHRKGKEVPPSFKQFFSSSLALIQINLSGTKLSPEPLKALLLGLACNHSLKGVSLDLSNCELGHCLRSGGAQVLEGCIAEIHNITSLDISDNGLESDLSTLIVWLSKNRSIQHLALGKNFNNMKSKNLTPVLDNLVQMIQDEDSPLQSLSLADSKLKAEVTIIINALGSNTSLTKVDISGNGMGDMGAKMLAKALQINTKLRTVIWDKNNITAQGFQDIAVAMEKNYTLRFMPIPMYDAAQALKTNPEKTEEALQKIENYLLRNHETRKYLQEQAYRLQQGIVTSTTQQMIDRICVKVQDHLNSLRACGGDAIQEDLKAAERLMRDAKNSKTLLPNLYHVGGASWAGASGLSSSPIQETLESMAGEVTRVVDEQLKDLLESMVDAAETLCPNVMRKAHIRQDLIHASTEKISIPRTFVKNVLLEQSGIDILNKISEVKLTVASFLSDRIVDEILDSLSSSHRKLANHFSRLNKSLPQREDLEVELVEEKPVKRAILTVEDLTEVERLEDLDTCMMTPKSKRKSIHSRMLRPVSRAFEMEFDLDKALEEVPIHIEDPPFPSVRQEKRSSGLISELPSEEGRRLEHFTKLRPKRNKKQQPTQAAVCTISILPQDGEQNGLMGRVDEGVDEFFTKKVTKMDCKRSSSRSSDAHELGEGDEKKKRDSRRSGFLNLIKSRSRSERPPTVLMTEELSSPKGAMRSPPVDTTRKEIKAAEHNGAPDRTEEIKTPEPLEEGPAEEAGRAERSDSRGSPQGGRRYVQVMGSGLLAEMKAKQERRAACAQKKLGNDVISQDPSSPVSCNTERLEGGATVPKLQPGLPEARFGSGTPEKNAKAEPRVDGGCRSRSSSSMPTSPKPLLQSPKPSPSARPSIPQKPRTASRPEDTPDSPSGPSSPKVALLPPILKKVSSDKERDGQNSSQSSPRSFSQEASRRSWGPAQEYQEQKQRSSGKDGHQGSKCSDSGEEAEKEFIFV
ncbi:F-actin-uncapping protein LRRC16A isoform 1 [Mus musculus]|uniref:F-actin-uncapping protein LRRC16A n=1 Tax=Mus musculus TaxID=10090 RepID=CARL1_MOUSE|nr:F-actin-uncapping protein LRRC16A isoform 1 [Mus musculus]Q6EDY6.2 RecName: Full=F-actin-uncapping protein LRRC16A; AltName: Full=CARMIL homolog; AltName: Full=Capping protein regulator and myosin 1 linker protein 1; AltName: Full=Capping protein, Arp2/3 and myosin-I linker homolog 1; AltName: Full=Capping protein, Arp2/3 and myosin-I linker protein 1; Short=CARML1; AltName: Full=Leucine-rich repeat-containing protein 16A [Mus musculus]AAI67257.1 Leucine rich repeat containing 16A [synthetic c|eukprot:NP_081101.3 F-actin-uncapping protein LRRC16A isoform 1 [Mus musculus]